MGKMMDDRLIRKEYTVHLCEGPPPATSATAATEHELETCYKTQLEGYKNYPAVTFM
jgi:hypothetical protein